MKPLGWVLIGAGFLVLVSCADPVLENPFDPASPQYSPRPPRCSAVEFSPDTGALTPSDSVLLSCPTPGAPIFYTLDGTSPTSALGVTSPASLSLPSGTTTVRAVATKPGWDPSPETSQGYSVLTLVQSWEFDTGLDGWAKPGDNLNLASWAWNGEGAVDGTVVGPDPRVWSPKPLSLHLASVKLVEVRLKNDTSGTRGSLFWQIASQPWGSTEFAVVPHSDYTVYRIDVSSQFSATDTLYQWRLDPENNEKTGSFSLDFFRVYAGVP